MIKEGNITEEEWENFYTQLLFKDNKLQNQTENFYSTDSTNILRNWEIFMFSPIKSVIFIENKLILETHSNNMKLIIKKRQSITKLSMFSDNVIFESGSCKANAAYHALSGNIKRMLERGDLKIGKKNPRHKYNKPH